MAVTAIICLWLLVGSVRTGFSPPQAPETDVSGCVGAEVVLEGSELEANASVVQWEFLPRPGLSAQAVVDWYPGSHPQYSTPYQGRASLVSSSSSLRLARLALNNSGRYQLRVDTDLMKVYNLRVLAVMAKPRIVVDKRNRGVRLTCSVHGSDLRVSWQVNGIGVPSGHPLSVSADNHTLSIPLVSAITADNYTCLVSGPGLCGQQASHQLLAPSPEWDKWKTVISILTFIPWLMIIARPEDLKIKILDRITVWAIFLAFCGLCLESIFSLIQEEDLAYHLTILILSVICLVLSDVEGMVPLRGCLSISGKVSQFYRRLICPLGLVMSILSLVSNAHHIGWHEVWGYMWFLSIPVLVICCLGCFHQIPEPQQDQQLQLDDLGPKDTEQKMLPNREEISHSGSSS